MIDAYANRTGTRRNLDALREARWGLLLCASKTPSRDHRTEGFSCYMLDNAAFKCRDKGDTPEQRWDYWLEHFEHPFWRLLDEHGLGARLVVLPDIYCGGALSLRMSLDRLDWINDLSPSVISHRTKCLIPVQDGMTAAQLRPHLGPDVGIAVGGSTQWKWRTLAGWCWLGRDTGSHVHVLRANSARMVAWSSSVGAHSFDGSGPSKFADCLRRVEVGREPCQMTAPGLELPSPFTPREGKFR